MVRDGIDEGQPPDVVSPHFAREPTQLPLDVIFIDGEVFHFCRHLEVQALVAINIADALEEQIGREVDRRKIDLEEPLKDLGTHAVTIRLAPEAEAKITVIIEREE